MNPKGIIYQYAHSMQRSDWCNVVIIPLILTSALESVVYFGSIQDSVLFLTGIIPTISSIIMGFLGMIIIASLSSNRIFKRMRKKPVHEGNLQSESMFHLFILGIFFNLILELTLLLASIVLAIFNSSYVLDANVYCLEFFLLFFLLLSSFCLFINNMDRILQVTLHHNP